MLYGNQSLASGRKCQRKIDSHFKSKGWGKSSQIFSPPPAPLGSSNRNEWVVLPLQIHYFGKILTFFSSRSPVKLANNSCNILRWLSSGRAVVGPRRSEPTVVCFDILLWQPGAGSQESVRPGTGTSSQMCPWACFCLIAPVWLLPTHPWMGQKKCRWDRQGTAHWTPPSSY